MSPFLSLNYGPAFVFREHSHITSAQIWPFVDPLPPVSASEDQPLFADVSICSKFQTPTHKYFVTFRTFFSKMHAFKQFSKIYN